ncbi:MAG: glycosyltransferase family 2 protein [Solirubrobacteraceae bacterium]
MGSISVAIPVLNGGPLLGDVLAAVAGQDDPDLAEIVVCDSGSDDGSVERARAAGARVIGIDRRTFGHGRTRNLLMRETRGDVVAFLTQDAVPAGAGWLRALTAPFGASDAPSRTGDDRDPDHDGARTDGGPTGVGEPGTTPPDASAATDGPARGRPDHHRVALACGPYLARSDASIATARELEATFATMAGPDGAPRVYRPDELPDPLVPSAVTFHTDANGALLRRAWERTPFRDVAYAEDQWLALDLLRAGWSRAFVPAAAVVHSHDYPPGERFRRLFDEFRALHDVYGLRTDAHPRRLLGDVRARVRADRAWAAARGAHGGALDRVTLASLAHHTERAAAAAAGSRADRIPAALRRRLSRDGIA